MTLDELRAVLKNDRRARMKFIASAITFYEQNGVTVDEDILKNFDEDAIKAITGGGGGGVGVIASVIAVF